MLNPFLIARFVFLALLANLSLLILIFAAWNANLAVSAGLSVSATTIVLILNSCSAFVFLVLGLAELAVPQAHTSRLVFECCWSAGLSIFQIGAAISVSVNSPEICGNSSDWDLCASSYLLITTSWLSTLVASTYFFVLFFTTAAHSQVQTDIWHETVYTVHWFREPGVPKTSAKSDGQCETDSDLVSDSRPNDLESSRQSTGDHEKPPWAQSSQVRRGVDMPFKVQDTLPARTSTSTTISLPIVPPNAQGDTVGSRFIEKFRESQLTSRSQTPMHGSHLMINKELFPSQVDNHDLPIPLPRLSEWIRADAVKGVNVHTMPQSP